MSQPNTEALLKEAGPDWFERGKVQYEIALSGLDGGGQRRLTTNLKLDHYPSWSPGGDTIAFISGLEDSQGSFMATPYSRIASSFNMRVDRLGLYAMSPDGSDVRQLASQLRSVALAPPVWSPDGQHLAIVANEGDRFLDDTQTLYIVRADDSRLTRIGKTTAVAATWAPDGEQLAYVGPEGQDVWVARSDGTDMQRIWSNGLGDPLLPVRQISWSPGGSEILLVSDGVYVLSLDSGMLRQLPTGTVHGSVMAGTMAAWSPDGSEIAVHHPGEQILTVARDGTYLNILVQIDQIREKFE